MPNAELLLEALAWLDSLDCEGSFESQGSSSSATADSTEVTISEERKANGLRFPLNNFDAKSNITTPSSVISSSSFEILDDRFGYSSTFTKNSPTSTKTKASSEYAESIILIPTDQTHLIGNKEEFLTITSALIGSSSPSFNIPAPKSSASRASSTTPFPPASFDSQPQQSLRPSFLSPERDYSQVIQRAHAFQNYPQGGPSQSNYNRESLASSSFFEQAEREETETENYIAVKLLGFEALKELFDSHDAKKLKKLFVYRTKFLIFDGFMRWKRRSRWPKVAFQRSNYQLQKAWICWESFIKTAKAKRESEMKVHQQVVMFSLEYYLVRKRLLQLLYYSQLQKENCALLEKANRFDENSKKKSVFRLWVYFHSISYPLRMKWISMRTKSLEKKLTQVISHWKGLAKVWCNTRNISACAVLKRRFIKMWLMRYREAKISNEVVRGSSSHISSSPLISMKLFYFKRWVDRYREQKPFINKSFRSLLQLKSRYFKTWAKKFKNSSRFLLARSRQYRLKKAWKIIQSRLSSLRQLRKRIVIGRLCFSAFCFKDWINFTVLRKKRTAILRKQRQYYSFSKQWAFIQHWKGFARIRRQQHHIVIAARLTAPFVMWRLRTESRISQLLSQRRAELRYLFRTLTRVLKKWQTVTNKTSRLRRSLRVFRKLHPAPRCSKLSSIIHAWRYEYVELQRLFRRYVEIKQAAWERKARRTCFFFWHLKFEEKVVRGHRMRRVVRCWRQFTRTRQNWQKKCLSIGLKAAASFAGGRFSEFVLHLFAHSAVPSQSSIVKRQYLLSRCFLRRMFSTWCRQTRFFSEQRKAWRIKRICLGRATAAQALNAKKIIELQKRYSLQRSLKTWMRFYFRRLKITYHIRINSILRKPFLHWLKCYNYRAMKRALGMPLSVPSRDAAWGKSLENDNIIQNASSACKYVGPSKEAKAGGRSTIAGKVVIAGDLSYLTDLSMMSSRRRQPQSSASTAMKSAVPKLVVKAKYNKTTKLQKPVGKPRERNTKREEEKEVDASDFANDLLDSDMSDDSLTTMNTDVSSHGRIIRAERNLLVSADHSRSYLSEFDYGRYIPPRK